MGPSDVQRILTGAPPPGFPKGDLTVRQVQEHVYRARVEGRLILVKWIAESNTFGQNELRVGRLFAHYPVFPAPRLLFEKPLLGGLLAGWEWIDGHDLRSEGRENLIEAFSRLGDLHRMLRNEGEVVSPLSGERFSNVSELLASETYRLTAPFDGNLRNRCAEVMEILEAGYPTLIHGDMHPGNIIYTDRKLWFVDWAYACNSLNLFDLDYVCSSPVHPEGPAWAQITPQEAVMVLPAYFQAAGMSGVQYYQTHHAVMVWNLLRTYENSVKNGYRAELAGIREQLMQLLDEIG